MPHAALATQRRPLTAPSWSPLRGRTRRLPPHRWERRARLAALLLGLLAVMPVGCKQSTVATEPREDAWSLAPVGGEEPSTTAAAQDADADAVREAPLPDAPVATDPLAPLVSLGATWTYTQVEGWHDSLGAPTTVVERVTAVATVGALTVATIEVVEGDRKSTSWRVREGDRTWRLDHLGDDAPGADEAALRAALASEDAREVDLVAPSSPALGCSALACSTSGLTGPDPYALGRTFLPGVGVLLSYSAEYSPETGDGTTTIKALTGYALPTRPAPVAVTDEPADFATLRARVHRVAEAGDYRDLTPLLAERILFSLHPEHTSPQYALECWKGDPRSRALEALTLATQQPCGLVHGATPFVACPRRFALAHGALGAAEESDGRPRAIFVREGDDWRLGALLLGGDDDFFSTPEWSDAPPLPLSDASVR